MNNNQPVAWFLENSHGKEVFLYEHSAKATAVVQGGTAIPLYAKPSDVRRVLREAAIEALKALDLLLDFSEEPDGTWTFDDTSAIKKAFALAHDALNNNWMQQEYDEMVKGTEKDEASHGI